MYIFYIISPIDNKDNKKSRKNNQLQKFVYIYHIDTKIFPCCLFEILLFNNKYT